MMKLIHAIRKNPRRAIFLLGLVAFTAFNLIAYNHAYAMLHFTETGERTAQPEQLAGMDKLAVLLTGIHIPKPQNWGTPEDWGMGYETHQFSVLPEIALESWYVPHPNPHGLILMFHGYAAAKASLLPEAQALHEMRYAVLLTDFRGSGGSSGYTTTAGYLEADDVAAAYEYAQSIAPDLPIILYGQSMGAAAIFRAVSLGQVEPDAIIVEAIFDEMLTTVENRFSAIGLPYFPSAQALILWGSAQTGISGFSHNPNQYAANIFAPTLMLHGAHDPRVTTPQAQSVFDNLASEDKHFYIFEDAGHSINFSTQPQEWHKIVSSFLTRQLTP